MKNLKKEDAVYIAHNNLYSPIKEPSVWKQFVKLENKPINYLEIGVLAGINTIKVLPTFCRHPDSRLYCVDPWEDYDEYSEYKGEQNTNYSDFLHNIEKTGQAYKYVIKKEYSHTAVPSFKDDFFDLVFIDGNHDTEFVYKDGVMCLPKTKSKGYIVFDDYDWDETKKGIDKFLYDFKDQVVVVGNTYYQIFIKKL